MYQIKKKFSKNLIPMVVIALFALLSFGSCSKKSSSSSCTCKYKGASNQDTTAVYTTFAAPYTSLSQECSSADTVYKALFGSSYGCHM